MVVSLVNKDLEGYERKVTGLTCATAISTGTQISTFRRNDEPMLKMGIQMMIEDVISFHGALGKIQEFEIENLVARILANYWWMKLEEIAYVFNKGKEGHYGKIYGTISTKTIYEWVQAYDTQERDHNRVFYNRDLQEKTNSDKVLSDEQLKEFYKNPDTSTIPAPDGSERMKDRNKGQDSDYEKQRAEYFKLRSDPGAKGGDKGTSEVKG
jgi:hypothetical protein